MVDDGVEYEGRVKCCAYISGALPTAGDGVDGKYEQSKGICKGCPDLEGGGEGPKDRPRLGDAPCDSWYASDCGEILFLLYGTFLQSDPVRSWVY